MSRAEPSHQGISLVAAKPTFIVTVTAADRVGIIQNVAGSLREIGGNILELSQTVMRGFFTIILSVEFDQSQDVAALTEEITQRGKRFQLEVNVLAVAAEPAARSGESGGERYILTVLGKDQPGNIHGIAGCLANLGVNILDLHARVDGDRFSLIMEAFLPTDLQPATVRTELERFGKTVGLEVYVQHENIFRATSEPHQVRLTVGR
jgi:glycine cleavage system transcriptional repressor